MSYIYMMLLEKRGELDVTVYATEEQADAAAAQVVVEWLAAKGEHEVAARTEIKDLLDAGEYAEAYDRTANLKTIDRIHALLDEGETDDAVEEWSEIAQEWHLEICAIHAETCWPADRQGKVTWT